MFILSLVRFGLLSGHLAQAIGKMNTKGERILKFVLTNKLVVGNT